MAMFRYMFGFMHNIIQNPRQCKDMNKQLEPIVKLAKADIRQERYIDYQYDLVEELKEEFNI